MSIRISSFTSWTLYSLEKFNIIVDVLYKFGTIFKAMKEVFNYLEVLDKIFNNLEGCGDFLNYLKAYRKVLLSYIRGYKESMD